MNLPVTFRPLIASDRAKLEPTDGGTAPVKTGYEVRSEDGRLIGFIATFYKGDLFHGYDPRGESLGKQSAVRQELAEAMLAATMAAEAAPGYAVEVLLGTGPDQRTVYYDGGLDGLTREKAEEEFAALCANHAVPGPHTILLSTSGGVPVKRRTPDGRIEAGSGSAPSPGAGEYGILYDGGKAEPRPRPTVEILIKTYRRRGCVATVSYEAERDVITFDRERYEPTHRYLVLYTPPGASAALGLPS